MKSGERPIIPQVARAQFSIILLRVSSASLVFGMSNERPTGSPLDGDLIGHHLAQLRVVLHVVEVRDRPHAARQPLVRRHVAHPLAAEPDLALLLRGR